MIKLIFRSFVFACLAVISACSVTHKVDGEALPDQRIGRFAVLVVDKTIDARRDAVQGGFVWLDEHDVLRVDLTNPLGNTIARVEVFANGAVLTRSSGERIVADDVDALVAQALNGYPIPVSGLRYWVQGKSMPTMAMTNEVLDEQGRRLKFIQNGWLVSLSEYDDFGPRRLLLERDYATKRITVRITIDS